MFIVAKASPFLSGQIASYRVDLAITYPDGLIWEKLIQKMGKIELGVMKTMHHVEYDYFGEYIEGKKIKLWILKKINDQLTNWLSVKR